MDKSKFTFFNEEWNQPFWEDNADTLDTRNKNKKENGVIED